jgi:hypothetical protein
MKMRLRHALLLGLAVASCALAGRLEEEPAPGAAARKQRHDDGAISGCVSWSGASNSLQFTAGIEGGIGGAPSRRRGWPAAQTTPSISPNTPSCLPADGGGANSQVVCGSFSPGAQHKSNFGQLRVRTCGNHSWPDSLQMQVGPPGGAAARPPTHTCGAWPTPGRPAPPALLPQAAGYLEGYASAQQIFDHWCDAGRCWRRGHSCASGCAGAARAGTAGCWPGCWQGGWPDPGPPGAARGARQRALEATSRARPCRSPACGPAGTI